MSALPRLVCLNLQHNRAGPQQLRPPRAGQALANASACVAWARRRALPVLHVMTATHEAERETAPLPGFEARSNEHIAFKRGLSLFDEPQAARWIAASPGALVVGFAGAEDCLSSALDAQRHGARLVFVTDAIASRPLGRHPPETVDAIIGALLAHHAAGVTTEMLLSLELQALLEPARLLPIGGPIDGAI